MKLEIITDDGMLGRAYLLGAMIPFWQAKGYDVPLRPLGSMSDGADLALLHVDLTYLDPEVLAREEEQVKALNGKVLDISKQVISNQIIKETDCWDGPVIVKTNLNSGGKPEVRYSRRRSKLHKLWQSAKRKIPACLKRDLTASTYPIFSYSSDVPTWVWSDERYVVERFLPERSGKSYIVRNWVFMGDKEYCVTNYSDDPVIKSSNVQSFKEEQEVPLELHTYRRKFHLDYGKIDWVLVNNEPFIMDVNKTPIMRGRDDRHLAIAKSLADGLEYYGVS